MIPQNRISPKKKTSKILKEITLRRRQKKWNLSKTIETKAIETKIEIGIKEEMIETKTEIGIKGEMIETKTESGIKDGMTETKTEIGIKIIGKRRKGGIIRAKMCGMVEGIMTEVDAIRIGASAIRIGMTTIEIRIAMKTTGIIAMTIKIGASEIRIEMTTIGVIIEGGITIGTTTEITEIVIIATTTIGIMMISTIKIKTIISKIILPP